MDSIKLMRTAKTGYLVLAALFCAMGVTMLTWPDITPDLIGWGTGAILAAFGILRIVGHCSRDPYGLAFQHDPVLGILAIALGLVFLMYFLSLVAALVGSRQEIAGNVLNAVTPFGYSSGSEILARGGLNPVWTAVGVALTACGIALAYLVYRRKDIR